MVFQQLTFLQFLQPPPNTLVRPADDIYARDLVRPFLLEFVQGAQGVDAEGVCAAEEDPEWGMVFGW
jgi:hypothetical protein